MIHGIFLTIAVALPGPSLSSLDVPFVSAQPVIDGRLDDSIWASATQVELDVETRPGENTAAQVRTTAFLVENGRSLFVAFRAYDENPEQIRAFLRDRDSAYNDDFVGVVLDTFNDERRAYEFFANAVGSQMDLIQDDVNDSEDDAWDAIWNSAGRLDDAGYTVEMEIPFQALSFPKQSGQQTWGLDLLRFYPRESRYRISINPLDRDINCYLCQLRKATGFSRATPGRNLEITPTLTATQFAEREDIVDGSLQSEDPNAEFGLDINWGMTPNLNLSATINPDFSQVEADTAQLNVNETFALFFPETRPFFLEAADYFDAPFRVVYTRNIADPDYGVKLTGKVGRNNVGAFFAQDTLTGFLLPGSLNSDIATLDQNSRNGVIRLRRDIGDNSSIGLLTTGRFGDDYHNVVGGLDAAFRLSEKHSVNLQFLQADSRNPELLQQEFEGLSENQSGHAGRISYIYDSRDWSWFTSYRDVGEDFRADLGFMSKVDYRQAVAGGGYTWIGDAGDWWDEMNLSGDWDITYDQSGRLLEREWEGEFSIRGPMQSYVEVGGGVRDRLWENTLFDEHFIDLYGEFQPVRGLFLALYTRLGDQVDFANARLASVTRLEPRVNWNIGRKFLLRLRHRYETLERDGGSVYEANLSDLRLSYQFSLRSRLKLTLQYTNIDRTPSLYRDPIDARDRELGTQLIYSYKVNPRTVLFAGYSDNSVSDDSVDSLVRQNRFLFLKLGYAWQPRVAQ